MQPQEHYRREHRRLILAEGPASVLDVGCGDGDFLRFMGEAGVHAEGLEADAAVAEATRATGLVVHHGRGEELPFADASFDVVASEFSAHHFADLSRHLAEACRVARRAVLLLDPWYDDSIENQRVTARWDRWFKAIDRQRGRVHHDALSAEAFRAALPDRAGMSFECRHYLVLQPLPEGLFERENADYLPLAQGDPAALAELDAIGRDRERLGMSDDGAIQVILRLAP